MTYETHTVECSDSQYISTGSKKDLDFFQECLVMWTPKVHCGYYTFTYCAIAVVIS